MKDLFHSIDEIKSSNNLESELLKLEKPQQSTAELMELNTQEATLNASLNNSIPLMEWLPIADKKTNKENLLRRYKDKKNKFDTFESKFIKCDSCGNDIDLTKEAKEMLQEELDEIMEEDLKLKVEIKKIESENAEIEKKNKQIKTVNKTKQDEIVLELNKISVKKSDILAKDEMAQKEYESKKQEVLDKHKASQIEINEKINSIKEHISALETEEREVISFNAGIDAAIEQNEKVVKDQEQNELDVKNTENKIKQLKLAIDAAKQYNSIKLKKQSEQIKPYLDKVVIQFEKLTKEGELKDDFKIVYEDKDFNKLSASEKIKAGLEIANLLMNIQNLHFPIFVDDTESINVVPELDTQMIKARVTLDKEIKVEVIE